MASVVHQLGAARRRLPQIIHARSITTGMMRFRPFISRESGRRAGGASANSWVAQHQLYAAAASSSSSVANASRSMSSNAPQRSTDDADGQSSINDDAGVELSPSVLANIYNHRRAHYNRAVSALRKRYFDEISEQRMLEARRKAREEAKIKREALERRRLKAIRVAENAKRQVEKREARRREWEGELEYEQRRRDERKALYGKAKQRIVDELEKECHLWLTTSQEVEKALGSPLASQRLWARPGSLIGAPSGLDTGFGDMGDFWRYECHTNIVNPTYKTPREAMLEEMEYMSYLRANINPKYWTKERVREHEGKEQRARLRAILREEGRRSLLNKQREMMRDVYGGENAYTSDDKGKAGGGRLPPTAMPAPRLDYLADYEAQEKEGIEIMMRDPRRFFIFESDLPSSSGLGGGMGGGADADENGQVTDEDGNVVGDVSGPASVGASLGRPVALRNPFFNDKPTAFPIQLGRDLPPDTRTEKEKKRDERQERMRQAAEEAALAASKGASYEVAMAAEEDLEDGSEDVDYNKAEEEAEKELWVDQEELWSDMDRKVFNMTPAFARLTPDDLDWVIDEMKRKIDKTTERIEFEDKIRRKEMQKSMSSDVTKPIESMEEIDRYVMEGLGYDMDKIEALVQQLTPEQSEALEDIDFTGRVGITAEEMTNELSVVPGLTQDQVQALVEMEMSLLNDEKLKAITKMS